METFLVLDRTGAYRGTLSISAVSRDFELGQFIKLPEAGEPAGIADAFGEAFSLNSLPVGTSVAAAYTHCVENGPSRVPVVDTRGGYKGVFSRAGLDASIAQKAIAVRQG